MGIPRQEAVVCNNSAAVCPATKLKDYRISPAEGPQRSTSSDLRNFQRQCNRVAVNVSRAQWRGMRSTLSINVVWSSCTYSV
jgi:hypothetical protein